MAAVAIPGIFVYRNMFLIIISTTSAIPRGIAVMTFRAGGCGKIGCVTVAASCTFVPEAISLTTARM